MEWFVFKCFRAKEVSRPLMCCACYDCIYFSFCYSVISCKELIDEEGGIESCCQCKSLLLIRIICL